MRFVKKFRKFFRLATPLAPQAAPGVIEIHSNLLPVIYRRHPRARNYLLRLNANRAVVVTVPRGGSLAFAREFVASRRAWLEKQWRLLESRRVPPPVLRAGMDVLFRGRLSRLEEETAEAGCIIRFDNQSISLPEPQENLRPAVEAHLQRLAVEELPRLAAELARKHEAPLRRVVVRNQKSRWGSCSCKGTISLNWRLIQVPDSVRDYIILHELMHLRQMNHSRRFWAEVERVCPDYRAAEEWLKKNSAQVRF